MSEPPDKQERENVFALGGEDTPSEATPPTTPSPSSEANPLFSPTQASPGPPRRQSSFAQIRPHGSRRTSNRVHFAESHRAISPATERSSLTVTSPRASQERGLGAAGLAIQNDDAWLDIEQEDYLTQDQGPGRGNSNGSDSMSWAPLLADIEAPSITVATDEFNPEDLLENARPKSNLRSAFMNMANSIM